MLYICATPIGNLSDISLRALEILAKSDIILCEDTRTSKKLLSEHQLSYKRLVSMHEHNENEIADKVLAWLADGLTVTQISDAGTPGISDPGSRLCNKVLLRGYKVSPLPGACAYISLLSVAGIHGASLFYGFLPATKSARSKVLSTWLDIAYAICIYEAPHRIVDCLSDIVSILGSEREIIMGRELTKQFETIKKSSAKELLEFVLSDANQQRGEFVLILCPAKLDIQVNDALTAGQINALCLLAEELPPKKAVNLTNKLFGGNKDLLYNYLLGLKNT